MLLLSPSGADARIGRINHKIQMSAVRKLMANYRKTGGGFPPIYAGGEGVCVIRAIPRIGEPMGGKGERHSQSMDEACGRPTKPTPVWSDP